MQKKLKAKILLERFNIHYPGEIKCYLNYTRDYELLFATILSAQCTDERVNTITEKLFKKYSSLSDYAGVDIEILEEDVKSAGFYRNKAKNIKESAIILIEKHNQILPKDLEQLTSLPGVGRKTANVVRCHIFNLPSVVVDTHVQRISKKLGLTDNTNPVKIEFDLMKILPKKDWIRYNHQTIAHGRKICKAPRPRCNECFLTDICREFIKNKKSA